MMQRLSALVGLGLLASASSLSESVMSVEEAYRRIQEDVAMNQEKYDDQSLCEKYTCCEVSDSEGCALDTLPSTGSSLVLPGGDTRCIFSYSTPYAFQVYRGDSDKLLFFFQGGGACWDEISTELGFCTTDVSPSGSSGVFDKSNDLNDYKDYTIVQVLYCSGDVHSGDSTRPYNDKDGVPVQQQGLANAQATLNWVRSQQENGHLATELSDLVVMGCSAGSLGAQIWFSQIVNTLQFKKVSVVPDSFAGVLPPGTQGPLIRDFGYCKSGFLSPELEKKCYAGEVTLQEMDMEALSKNPDVPVGFIQSKTDDVQIWYYIAVGATSPNTSAAITPTEFYHEVNEIFELYNTNKNFLTYLVDGQQHCFTPSSVYYTADCLGPDDNGSASSKPMLHTWAGQFPLSSGESAATQCEGELQLNFRSYKGLRKADRDDNTYCDAELFPKEYTQN